MTRLQLRHPPRPWLWAALGLGLLGCRNDNRAIDPNDGAIHLPVIGQTDPYGQATEVEPTKSEAATKFETLGGRYGADVAMLSNALGERWANRARHEELDGVDVDQILEDLATAAGKADNEDVFAVAVREATCRLSDGHLRIHKGPSRGKTWTSGMHVVYASGDFVVAEVDGDHWETGSRKPKRGDIVEKVDGTPVATFADETCLSPGSTAAHRELLAARSLGRQYRFATEKPSPSKMTVRRAKKRHTITLDWQVAGASEPGPCVEGKMIGKAGWVVIHTFACGGADDEAARSSFMRQLDGALRDVASAKSLAIDLRHNGGGSDAQAKIAASRLIPETEVWMRFRHADDETSEFRDEVLEAKGATASSLPMTVVIGPGCASTCEVFASVLAGRPDTVLVGQPTAGSVGNPQPLKLPTSGFTIWVPLTQYALPGTDVLIEGRGVTPQVEVMTTTDDIRRRRDPALENALKR